VKLDSNPTDVIDGSSTASCFHCGERCDSESFSIDNKFFCCYGCKTVYEILAENELCEYYDFASAPGLRFEADKENANNFLDGEKIKEQLLLYEINGVAQVQFSIPAIHCISCIWLLENLNRMENGILKSEVNFAKKVLKINYRTDSLKLSRLATLLANLGYKPVVNLEGREKPLQNLAGTELFIQLAIAGFCFGNIMLLSFPEYLGIDQGDQVLINLFSYLNIFLALPVVVYSAKDYFMSAWNSFKHKQINIDVPIAIGILVLFSRSVVEILSKTGPGYMDSLAGLVFFLLIGRWFQSRTYESLSFDRDYKSYFPLAVFKKDNGEWHSCVVHDLKKGDEIRIRNNEIVPADSLLQSEFSYIDYSFVTGEAKPVKALLGELVYAGGRIVGQPAMLIVKKETSQSHLTSLWNNAIFNKSTKSDHKTLIDKVASAFTWTVLGIALLSGIYWYYVDPSRVWLVMTAVLMVACPCALALAAPFTYGSMLREFGKHGLYLRNAGVIERLASINAIVFDKTGTVTHGSNEVIWVGEMTKDELSIAKALASASTHPLSSLIAEHIDRHSMIALDEVHEFPGKGVEGKIGDMVIRLGSGAFVGVNDRIHPMSSIVHVCINGRIKGYFEIKTSLRRGIISLALSLGDKVKALLSGDGPAETERMKAIFSGNVQTKFHQTPHDKLNYIADLQGRGAHVMMIGDGLNDAGALKQSDVGIAVSDNSGVFTPSSDGILQGDQLQKLNVFLDLSKTAVRILNLSLVLSFMYNIVGLTFAITGNLTPIVAAILMPISSISIVAFTTLAVNVYSKRKFA